MRAIRMMNFGARVLRLEDLPDLQPRRGRRVRVLEPGPLTHGWTDQRWTLARVKTMFGQPFHVSSAAKGHVAVTAAVWLA